MYTPLRAEGVDLSTWTNYCQPGGQKTRKYHVFVAVQTQLKSNQGMVAF